MDERSVREAQAAKAISRGGTGLLTVSLRRDAHTPTAFARVATLLWLVALSVQAGALRIASVSNAAYPPAVDAGGRTTTVYAAEMMLDGNPHTFACMLDDSPTGANADALPKNGSAPVTGTLAIDLGGEYEVDGVELVSRADGGCYLPREVELLGMTCRVPAVSAGAGHLIRFAPRKLKAVELKILSSYESGPAHFNYQIAELRVSVKDGAGARKMLSGTGESPSPVLDEDRFVVAEREYAQSGRNRTEPFPSARMLKDWLYQDYGLAYTNCFVSKTSCDVENRLVTKVLAECADGGLDRERSKLQSVPGCDPQWEKVYVSACEKRRAQRLAGLAKRARQIVFAKHYFLSGVVHYAWTEDLTDEQYRERNPDYRLGASLNQLTLGEDGSVRAETLLDLPGGVIRDPSVSYDAQKILFSMRRNDKEDDFHLYVLDVATRRIKQITFGLGVSDIEPCWLSNGDIVFVSSRCIQNTDCWRQYVSNLYTCDGEGRFMRRLGYDQVHTNYPQTLEDGRVTYTRWEYNDRGQVFPQPLMVMNFDGTAQAEYYGGTSWFPTSILHARGIPGTQKMIAIAAGHHTMQKGKLIVVDRSKGTQEDAGIEYLAPRRKAVAERNDFSGSVGEAFQYPYAFDEQNYLVTFCPEGTPHAQRAQIPVPFGVYFMTEDGRRELLAYDPATQCAQAVPLIPRAAPPLKPSLVDYTKTMGSYYIQDVNVGQAVEGVARGTVKAVRVVALEYRAADAYYNSNIGEAGRSHCRTPPAINNASWDVKHVLGTVPVEADGSAYFEVPARTPVYFQLLDANGYVVQTMRSWSTLQPGESQACVGCHESKNASPPPAPALAMRKGARKLTFAGQFAEQYGAKNPITDKSLSGRDAVKAFLTVNSPDGFGEPEGFSYPREVQPILDRHCVKCHNGERSEVGDQRSEVGSRGRSPSMLLSDDGGRVSSRAAPFSLKGDVLPYAYAQCPNNGDASQNAHRAFTASYLNLTKFGHGGPVVNWISAQSRPSLLPPYFAGAARSGLMKHLEPEHHAVKVTKEEKERVACWIDLCVPFCGSYTEANQWEPAIKATYLYFEAKRARLAEIEIDNIRKFVEAKTAGKTYAVTDFRMFDQGGPEARRKFERTWLEKGN